MKSPRNYIYNALIAGALTCATAFGSTPRHPGDLGSNAGLQNEATACHGGAYQHLVQPIYDNAWFGTKKDIETVIGRAEDLYGFENTKHLGRNATMLVPATLWEMKNEIDKYGNPSEWKREKMDGAHAPNAKRTDNLFEMWAKSNKGEIEKYTNKDGGEVVYDVKTGKIVTNEKMGTYNFEASYNKGLLEGIGHYFKDMRPNAKVGGDQYKYVGILYERDSIDPEKYYIIDGQTGLPMPPQRVEEMPTTISDMWKGKGFACVADDAKDIVDPKSNNEAERESQVDLHSLDLDDENGDWCKCGNQTGCKETIFRGAPAVFWECPKCGKVNVQFARLALQREKEWSAQGMQPQWVGKDKNEAAKAAKSGEKKK